MKVDSFKNNRKALFALLLCSGFIATHPLAVMAESESYSVQNVQQKQTVSGIVKDSSGEPIIGASVLEKGTTNGTITDLDGKFTLSVSSNAVLQISYIGYKTLEVKSSPNMGVTLQEDTETLDEVVVVGFGTQKKVNLTGSVGMASAEDLESRPVANAVQALQGVIPGLNIDNSGNGGELNASKSIDIRGTGTVGTDANGTAYTSGSPLILIDGMEGDLNSINPQDIESISVLKDAAASSIYGSRAPFGVILVTTKSGKSGRAQINYNMNVRFQTPLNMPKMANSWEFVNLFDDANFKGSGNHLFEAAYMQQVKDYMEGKTDDYIYGEGSGGKWNYDYTAANVNWLDQYYRSMAPSHEHNVSASGGNDKVTYYVSGNYMGQQGFMRYGTDDYDRFTLTGKFSAQLTKILKVDYSSRFVRTDYSRPTYMNDDFYNHILRRARPVRAIYDPNGYLMSDINYIAAMRDGGRHKEQKDMLSQQFRFTLTPLKNWNIIGEMNIKTDNNWTHWDQQMIYSHYVEDPANSTYLALTSANKDQVSEYSLKQTYLNPTLYSNYNFSLDEKHNFTVMAGFQAEIMKYRDVTAARTGLTTSELPVLDQTTNVNDYTMSGLYKNWKTAGFFGRINYDYLGKYLVELNLRYDGSSRYRRENRWIWTPSFSLGWNIAREDFWGDLANYVETFKLRGSYGELANQNTTNWYPTYQIMDVVANSGAWLQGGAKPNTSSVPLLVSDVLTWEKIKNTNIGFDFGAFNNRLTGSFDYFWRKTKNMVGPGVEVPAILGTAVPVTNNCDLTTFGWELSIGWRDRIGELSYGVKLNISDNQTRIDRYANPTNSLSTYIAGELTGDIYGYETIGIAKTQEEMDAHLATLPNGGQTALGTKWEAGDIMYADLNGDGKIDGEDRVYLGSWDPSWTFGLNLSATWKGFDASVFFQGAADVKGFLQNETVGRLQGNTAKPTALFRDSWDAETNPNGKFPRPLTTWRQNDSETNPSDFWIINSSYLRMKNIQVGYTLPKNVCDFIRVPRIRIYYSGQNLLTFTGFSDGFDPEAPVGARGYYPQVKVNTFGLNVTF